MKLSVKLLTIASAAGMAGAIAFSTPINDTNASAAKKTTKKVVKKTTKKSSKKATKAKSVTIYLTRHGETTGNVMGRVQGWSDFPLTTNGIKVADQLGYGLKGTKFKAAYAGNLTRQEVTAEHALKYSGNSKVKVNISKFLREGGYGSFEGDSIAADNNEIAGVYGYKDGTEFQQATGKDYWNMLQDAYYKLDQLNSHNTKLASADRAENSGMVQQRMTKELNKIAKTTQKNGGGNVLVVSSGMSINEYLSTMAPNYTGASIPNAAVTKLVYKNGKLSVNGPIASLSYVDKGAQMMK
ncbi:histidine phosphatase family protein [Lentilactobacillus curieae]|uniref:Histidine phosphatase family protein n=1 Tax=Lentilactobacillus curieae TaxID=1138822 RepID=A0A1S6QGA2_9LACO|nr:histidine phosphatase family protein [Lentilactobacillus curieae]AQW20630.1 histidine phosphatase family protein [Lentilactobacillus curieae]